MASKRAVGVEGGVCRRKSKRPVSGGALTGRLGSRILWALQGLNLRLPPCEEDLVNAGTPPSQGRTGTYALTAACPIPSRHVQVVIKVVIPPGGRERRRCRTIL